MERPTRALNTAELARRKRERIIVVILFCFLVAFTAVEVHLLRVSSKLPFVNSIFFFGVMNLNVILIMLLLFLVFRNAIKLILDERSGKTGSRLRTRLVVCFLLFAIIPTLMLFFISALYIKNSFDKWFNLKVGGTLQRSIDVVKSHYENSERNGSHFAQKIALAIQKTSRRHGITPNRLETFRKEYGLDSVEYYATILSPPLVASDSDRSDLVPRPSLESLQRLFSGKTDCKVLDVGVGEVVRCGALVGAGRGALFADYFVPIGLASQLSDISITYEDFKSDNPLNYPIKSTYFSMLSMVTLLILFSAIWTGFYVAKRLTVPIEELSKATDAVAQGDLNYQIRGGGSDELARLIESFNRMIGDLRLNKLSLEATHEELNRRRRYTEVLLESVQSAVLSFDATGKISMHNHAASQLLGRTTEELVGSHYRHVLPPEILDDFEGVLAALDSTAKPIRKELRLKRGEQDWATVLVTVSLLEDGRSRRMGIVAVLDDVTEIQKMERMIAWREVARRIAHEIKNPLTPIQLSVQRLRRRYLATMEDPIFEEATGIILKEVDSLKTLVNEFSSFARLPEIQPMPDDLNSIALEAVQLFRTAHEQILFTTELEPNLPAMELDRAQLKRVLINLFDNAVAAMEGKGTITIRTARDPQLGLVELSVADEGCGIDESVYARLFEPYVSTKSAGTGLGLAIVQKIVTDHGGFVRAAPVHPKGTRFIVELPASLVIGERKETMAKLSHYSALYSRIEGNT